MRTEHHGGKICLKSTLTRQLGCYPGLQTPSESRTLTLKSGISNSVVVNFQGGESPNFFEDSKFLSGRMWRGRSPGKDDRDVPGREQRSEGSCGREFGEKAKEWGVEPLRRAEKGVFSIPWYNPASLRRRKWGPIMGMRGPGHGLWLSDHPGAKCWDCTRSAFSPFRSSKTCFMLWCIVDGIPLGLTRYNACLD